MILPPSFWYILAGMVLMSGAASILSTILYYRQQTLTGDVVAHSVLPGIVLIYLLFQNQDVWLLIIGGSSSAFVAIFLIEYLQRKQILRQDILQASLLSIFFGTGIFLLSYLQQLPDIAKAGIDRLIFGQAAVLSAMDVAAMGLISLLVMFAFAVFHRTIKIWIFDRSFAHLYLPIRWIELIFVFIICLFVMTGVQSVGVLLMTAVFVFPASIAHFWANSLKQSVIYGTLAMLIASLLGVVLSLFIPHLPTGAAIVSVLFLALVVSLLLGYRHSVLVRYHFQKLHSRKIDEEHVLKALYKILIEHTQVHASWHDIHQYTQMPFRQIKKACRRLAKKKIIQINTSNHVTLTCLGKILARRIVRLHRLWEVYLQTHLHLPADHVHESAEEIEHYISPDIEANLLAIMDFPSKDPHQQNIP